MLCLDPTHFNKWIINPCHSTKLVNDILYKLRGPKYFTFMDSSSSFLNQKLDEEYSKLTTVGTPFGRYRNLRVPMGAFLSNDVYQYKVAGCSESIEQCMAIADNIIIYGYKADGSGHITTTRHVMKSQGGWGAF